MAIMGVYYLTSDLTWLGWFLLITGLVIIVVVAYENACRLDYMGVSMNSGETYLFVYKDYRVLEEAMEEIQEAMNWKNGNTIINFNNGQIDKFVQGDYIENLTVSAENWVNIENVWNNALKECQVGTAEYDFVKKAKEFTKKKDERGLIAFLQRNKDSILSGVITEAIKMAFTFLLKIPV